METNATYRPSDEMLGLLLSPVPFAPVSDVDTSVIAPVAMSLT
jgi:hypothetical protein